MTFPALPVKVDIQFYPNPEQCCPDLHPYSNVLEYTIGMMLLDIS